MVPATKGASITVLMSLVGLEANVSQAPARCSPIELQFFPNCLVGEEGVEPSRISAAHFECAVATITPPAHVLYLW